MKNLYFLIILLLCGVMGSAQNENNHWMIGGLDFNFSTNPNTVTTISNADYSSVKPTGATLSDMFGNIKYNVNYYNLVSSFPSYQSVTIVPHPGNANRCFLIYSQHVLVLCTDCQGNYSNYFYEEIDFTNNSAGESISYGLLTDNTGQTIENEGDFRPLTVVKNSTNTGYWVIAQSVYKILSFKIDASGLNTQPVATTLSSDVYQGFEPVFRVIPNYANPSNLKMYCLQPNIRMYSLDFNNSTGQFTNYQVLPGNNYGNHFEVSPDNQKLYIVNSSIVVKDLTSLSTPARTLYEFANPAMMSGYFSGIQKDKYGNLLVSSEYSNSDRNKYIHKIENPDSFLNSSVKVNHIYLNGKTYVKFLPQLIQESVPTSCSTETITLNTNQTVSRTYKAGNSITTNGSFNVNSGISTVLKGDDAIYLEPNTNINGGSYFLAEIEDCSNDGDRIAVYSETNSQSILPDSEVLTMYPNPSSDVTFFITNDDVIKSITIISLDGRIVFSKDVLSKYFELDVKDYPKGMYVASVVTEKGEILTRKLIKN